MQLDVVIVTHNSADHLDACLHALPTDVRIVVVDNASSDDSASVAEAAGVEVIRSTVNSGFAAGCNRGARQGSAKRILFLNPDAVIEADALRELVTTLNDPSVGVVSPRIMHPDGSKQQVKWPYPSALGAWREAVAFDRIFERIEEPDLLPKVGFVIGAVFAVRRDAFEAAGGFDERFWLYGEEADLCRRVEELGWSINYRADVVATHIGGASGGDDPASSALVGEHFIRGGEHFVDKAASKSALVSYRAANLSGSVARGALGLGASSGLHRRRMKRLAKTLTSHPARVALDSPATAAPGKAIVVCSLEAWDEVWRRNQFFVRELLAADPELRFLFIEPAYDVVLERKGRSGRRHQRGLRPVDEDGRIIRFEPVKWLPRKVGPMADDWRDAQVLDAVRQLGFEQPRLWVNDPSYATLADRVDWPAVYDITDDWTKVADANEAAKAQANEAKLFERCENVTVCSPGLLESRRALRDDLVLIPNAVDTEHLCAPQPRPADLPKGRCAVYVGTLHTDRLDVGLVCELAEAIGDVDVVLVGPDALDDISRARLDHSGVRRLGARPYSDIPGYLQHADVLIVPHVVSDFTESLDPIKAYECLAVGTPTVATPVAGFRDQPEPVRVASSDEFVETVKGILGDPPDRLPRQVPGWGDRAAAFMDVLGDIAEQVEAKSARKLRVVFFDHCAQLSGGELALARAIPALDGVDATVILGEHGPLEEVLTERGIKSDVFELDRDLAETNRYDAASSLAQVHTAVSTLKAVTGLRHRLRQIQPDLLHTNSLKAALIGGVAGRLAGVPVVWHIRDRMAADYLPAAAIKLVRVASYMLPTAIIVNSETTKAALGRADATVIPSPVEVDAYSDPDWPTRPEGGPVRFVMVGRLAPWKGQRVFLEAFAQAFAGGDETAAIAGTAMFGEDEYADSLETIATNLGIASQVEFLGFVADVPTLLRDCDVLVHASIVAEPFGQVVVEGMAAGLPVIATDGGGPAEVITNGVDGLLAQPSDVAELSAALKDLASNPERRAELGVAARENARAYQPAAIGPRMVAVFNGAISG